VIGESWTDLLSKHLADAAAGGGSYDIVTWPYFWMGHYVEGGLVEDLNTWFANAELADPRFDPADIPEAVQDVYGRYVGAASPNSDGLWALPYKFDVYLAQWRPDMFAAAGLVDADGNPRPPETWEQLLSDAKALQAAFPDIRPLAFPLAVDDPMVSTFLPILASYSGQVPIPWYDGNLYPTFRSTEGAAALDVLTGLRAYMPPDALDMDFDRVNAHMSQGLAAYALNWNAYLPVLLDPASSTISENVAFAPTPGGPAGQFSGLGGWVMGLSTTSENKDAAFQLMQFIGGRERAIDLAMAGGSVARYSVGSDDSVGEAFPYYPLLIESLAGYSARGKDRAWAELQRTIGVALNGVLLGQQSSTDGLTGAAGQVFDQATRAGYNPGQSGDRPK
jgi:multiple sugar transport system substrate-binding protein